MTATSPAPKPRRSRLQFSLRLLLLAFTAFAVGFPIWYRWPFEETEPISYSDDPFAMPAGTITRTWRRTWGGGRVLHGRVIKEIKAGAVKTIEHFENGAQHGKFETYVGGKLRSAGQYDRGKREGTWVEVEFDGKTTYAAHWHQDKLDGLYEIAFQDGRKQQYRFAMGRLIEANGKPVKSRLFEQLAAGDIDEPRIATVLSHTMSPPLEFVETPAKDAVMFLLDAYNLPILIDAHRISDLDRPMTLNVKGIDLCSGLTMLAAPHDLAFEYRYGVLRLTTAEHADNQRDLTGVTDIRPLPGSPLSRAWNEPCRLEAVKLPLDAALEELAQPLAIGFDLTGLPPEIQTKPVTLNLKNRSFKHFLGLILDQVELRCEARGKDTLVILPQQ